MFPYGNIGPEISNFNENVPVREHSKRLIASRAHKFPHGYIYTKTKTSKAKCARSGTRRNGRAEAEMGHPLLPLIPRSIAQL